MMHLTVGSLCVVRCKSKRKVLLELTEITNQTITGNIVPRLPSHQCRALKKITLALTDISSIGPYYGKLS